MIPGFVISWLTFPGVIVHELGHALMCKLFGLRIYEVCFFRFDVHPGRPAGYVIHERSAKPWQDMIVAIGPFLANTVIGAVVAAPAAIPVYRLGTGDVLDYFLVWLGVSIAMHAFPSTGDAQSIWTSVIKGDSSASQKMLAVPIVGLIYLGAVASIFWADLLYGVAVAGVLPNLIVHWLA